MKRLCKKMARDLKALSGELASQLDSFPADGDPRALEHAELVLRDAIANLRRVRNAIASAKNAKAEVVCARG